MATQKKSINELDLKPQQAEAVDYSAIPDEFSSAPPPPYPGTYRFRLPSKEELKVAFDTFEGDVNGKTYQFVSVIFDKDAPLVITEGKAHVGEPFTTRINNKPRNRSRKGDPETLISDGTYFLRALEGAQVKNYDNKGFIDAVIACGGKEFVADLEWSAGCNAKKQAYYADDNGNLVAWTLEDGSEKMGCGEYTYQNNWPRGADGRFLDRATCKCGASLRPFGGLRQFKVAK